jgi:hypothetical protein
LKTKNLDLGCLRVVADVSKDSKAVTELERIRHETRTRKAVLPPMYLFLEHGETG